MIEGELSKLERYYREYGGTLDDERRFRLQALLRDLKDAIARHGRDEARALEFLRAQGWQINANDLPSATRVTNALYGELEERVPGRPGSRLRALRRIVQDRLNQLLTSRRAFFSEAGTKLFRALARVGQVIRAGGSVRNLLGLVLLVAALAGLGFSYGTKKSRTGEVSCDCASIDDWGILTEAVQVICMDREQKLRELASRNKLNLKLDRQRRIVSGEVCDEDAQGERAWPAVKRSCPKGLRYCG